MSNAETLIHNPSISDAKAAEFAKALEASFNEGLGLQTPKTSTLELFVRTVPAVTLLLGAAAAPSEVGATKDCTVTLKITDQWSQISNLTKKDAQGKPVFTPGVDTIGGQNPGILFFVSQQEMFTVLKTDEKGVGRNADGNRLTPGMENQPFARFSRPVDDKIDGLTVTVKRGGNWEERKVVIACGKERTEDWYTMVNDKQAALLPKSGEVHAPRPGEKLLPRTEPTVVAPTKPVEAPKPAAKPETAPSKPAAAAPTKPEAAPATNEGTKKEDVKKEDNVVSQFVKFVQEHAMEIGIGTAVILGAVGLVWFARREKTEEAEVIEVTETTKKPSLRQRIVGWFKRSKAPVAPVPAAEPTVTATATATGPTPPAGHA